MLNSINPEELKELQQIVDNHHDAARTEDAAFREWVRDFEATTRHEERQQIHEEFEALLDEHYYERRKSAEEEEEAPVLQAA